MPAVEISFTALPAHVRTARLIAAAVARRAGIEGALLDEIRLAVGEACSRAVGVQQRLAPASPVNLTILDEPESFVVTVADASGDQTETASESDDPFAVLRGAATVTPGEGEVLDVLPSGFGLAVIAGLVDDLDVVSGPTGTVVRMTWKSPTRDVNGASA